MRADTEKPVVGHKADKARIETRDGCTLVFGALSLNQLNDLTQHGSPDDVLSPDLARLVGATFAYGTTAAVQALTARVRAEKLAMSRPASLASLEPEAQDWAVAGEVGLSAATIFAWITGIKLDHHAAQTDMPTDFPHDPADLRRCRLLLEAVPSFAERFQRVMPQVSPAWAALTAHWSTICDTMDLECPSWRSPSDHATCHDTYRLMNRVIEQGMPVAGVSPR